MSENVGVSSFRLYAVVAILPSTEGTCRDGGLES